ncbi:MAG: VCBS repeat-containing protein, partial [Saprospiraceae bacterium]|nr:VCBS repeat-containing protein [Saprospiraceae bacterium]
MRKASKRSCSIAGDIMCVFFIIFQLSFLACGNKDVNTQSKTDDARIKFELKSSEHTGIDFNNHIEERYETFFDTYAYVYTGGGVAVGDINNDGLQDVYFTGNEVNDRLYINKGDFRFEDVTETSILTGQGGWHNGVTILDINADGLNDIYVCRGGWKEVVDERKNLLYINTGNETFVEKAEEYGLADEGFSMQAGFFDMDNDNDLDLYLTNRPDEFYLPLSIMEERANNWSEYYSDRLYRNDGGLFVDISKEAGIVNYGYSLGVVTADFNNDGFSDVFVSNDYATVDHMYINQGDGTFKDELQKAINHISLFSMGTDVADIDNDGLEDIVVMEMRPEDYIRSKVSMPPMNIEGFHAIVNAGMHKQYMHNMLHLNRGNGIFSEVARMAGISKTDWSWAGLLGDFDNDGNRDLYVTNGMRRDLFDGDAKQRLTNYVNENITKYKDIDELYGSGFQGVLDSYKPLKLENYLFKGNADISFTDIGKNTSISIPSFSNGSALVDLDNDGDLDIVVNNMEDPAFIFENTTSNDHNWIKIKLQGPEKNRMGIGAKVWIHSGGSSSFFQQKIIRGYLSASDEHIFFGIGGNDIADSIIVHWPDGKKSLLTNVQSNALVTIQHKSDLRAFEDRMYGPKWFTESDNYLEPPHQDSENNFFEYRNQILLPHSFATSGPKMASADLNSDGIGDFYVGGSKSEPGALYLSSNDKWYKSEQRTFYLDRIFEDMGSVFLDFDDDGDYDIYVVSGGSDLALGDQVFQDRLYENQNGVFTKSSLPQIEANGSCVLKHDFDADGDMDLFVAGFVKPNKYPLGDESFFLENQNGTFVDRTAKWYKGDLSEIGIVYAATTAQVDEDAEVELILVGEWMPITILDWNGNQFENKTEQFGLLQTKGWWSSVRAADLDNDGNQDLIVGNLGDNYKFTVDEQHQFEVFANDFDLNGSYDVFLATQSKYGHKPVRGLECSSEQMPAISQKFESFSSFASAEIEDIIGPGINEAVNLKVDIFSSVILYNQGNKSFLIQKLPSECQLSIINGIVVADLNNDGLQDIITAGNRFNVEVETSPSDASVGSLLINGGNRIWHPVKPIESGIYLNGDVKDLMYLDGKLISTENNGPVR